MDGKDTLQMTFSDTLKPPMGSELPSLTENGGGQKVFFEALNKNDEEEESDDIDDFTELVLLAVSEFMSSAILMILSMGGEMSIGYKDRFGIAFVNGMAEMVCIYGFSELKADFNPAVTTTFVITGDCDLFPHGVVKIFAQLCGGLFGCLMLAVMFSKETDQTHHFAALKVGSSYGSAWMAEIILTYIVIFTIFQSAETNGEPGEALAATVSSPLAVGFTVIGCVAVAFPLTGASLNPMRALSTAAIGSFREGGLFKDMEVFFIGPLIAGLLVGLQERYIMHTLRALYAKVDFHSSTALTRISKSKRIEEEKNAEKIELMETQLEKMATMRPSQLLDPEWIRHLEESLIEAVENSMLRTETSRDYSIASSRCKETIHGVQVTIDTDTTETQRRMGGKLRRRLKSKSICDEFDEPLGGS